MKKFALALCLTLIAILFNGCGYKGYSGDNAGLYSEAINSLVWTNGHSYGADKETDAQIDIIEKDSYGRTLFTYYEKYYAGAKLAFSALLVSQYSDDGFVYYYEDFNYLIKRQELYTAEIENFTQEEIKNLKEVNDWDTDIKPEKCIKKEITNAKQNIPNAKLISEKIAENFELADREYNLFTDFLTDDDCGNFIFYGSIIKLNGEDIFFIGMGKDDTEELELLVPKNAYDYKQELIDFKEKNGWASLIKN